MKPRRILYSLIVSGLIVLNAWYWGLFSGPAMDSGKSPHQEKSGALATIRPEMLELLVPDPSGSGSGPAAGRRNLFQVKAKPAPRKKRVQRAKKPVQKQIDPREEERRKHEIAREAARKNMNRFKLIGVKKTNTEISAFITNGEEARIVHTGDRIEGRIVVDEITLNSISLRDSVSKISQQVPMTGN